MRRGVTTASNHQNKRLKYYFLLILIERTKRFSV
jgi:hypothetical protein